MLVIVFYMWVDNEKGYLLKEVNKVTIYKT